MGYQIDYPANYVMKKRRTFSILSHIWNSLLLGQAFEIRSSESARDTTRYFGQLVSYPKLIFDAGRTTNFRRLDDDVYEMDIRHKRYLGRGSYILSARVVGYIITDSATGETHITGYVRQGAFYLYALIFMTLFVAISYSLVPVSILFLPLALLMSAVIWLHWRFLLKDRRALYEDMLALFEVHRRSLLPDHQTA